jgi:cell wall-associated NlpC family hydrolase
MAEIADFVGLPYRDRGRDRDGVDCYGLVRAVLAELRGVVLPDYGTYGGGGDHAGIALTIVNGLAEGWRPIADPRLFDLVVFTIAKQPRHVGLMLGPTRFLHAPEPGDSGAGGTTRIERITDRMWRNRIEGFYRYG